MALDDIVNKSVEAIGNHTANLRDTVQRIKAGKGPSDSGKYEEGHMLLIANYTRDIPDDYDGNLNDDEVQELAATFQAMPEDDRHKHLNENLAPAYTKARDELIKRIEPNYAEIIGEFKGNKLYMQLLTSPTADVDDDYKDTRKAKKRLDKWQKALEEKDVSVYIDEVKHPLLKKILSKYKNSELLQRFMQNRSNKAYMDFMKPYADVDKLQEALKAKDDKAIDKALKKDEINKYLIANTAALEADKKMLVYESAGIDYSNYLIEKAKDEENKKTDEAFDKHGGKELKLAA